MRTHSKFFALAVMLITLGFSIGVGQADLLVDRGLPTANLNDPGFNRSNASFGFQVPTIAGDTFSAADGHTYTLDTLRVWVVGDSPAAISLYGGYKADPGGIKEISTIFTDTVVTYTGGALYQGLAGTYNIHQIDFKLNQNLSGGKEYYFFVNGSDGEFTPFVHGSNGLLSGSPQDGFDNIFWTYNTGFGNLTLINPALGLWDKSADLNVQVFGKQMPEPSALLLIGFGMAGLAAFGKKRRNA
jgi:hypothetical protein